MPVAGVVGRDREMAAVAAFLDALPSGPCGLVLEGAAGIGKTTVWRAGAAWAAGRSYTVLSCRPAESEVTLSFAALSDLLDGLLDQALPPLPPPQRRALEVALLLEDPAGSPPEPRAVAVAFLAVIRHLSASGPVVLAVDDLQWLDVPSARTVEFALRRLSQEPVGLLASARDPRDGRGRGSAKRPPITLGKHLTEAAPAGRRPISPRPGPASSGPAPSLTAGARPSPGITPECRGRKLRAPTPLLPTIRGGLPASG